MHDLMHRACMIPLQLLLTMTTQLLHITILLNISYIEKNRIIYAKSLYTSACECLLGYPEQHESSQPPAWILGWNAWFFGDEIEYH